MLMVWHSFICHNINIKKTNADPNGNRSNTFHWGRWRQCRSNGHFRSTHLMRTMVPPRPSINNSESAWNPMQWTIKWCFPYPMAWHELWCRRLHIFDMQFIGNRFRYIQGVYLRLEHRKNRSHFCMSWGNCSCSSERVMSNLLMGYDMSNYSWYYFFKSLWLCS